MEWALLADVPEAVRRDVLARCRRRGFLAGEVLFHDGDPSEGLHLVAAGHVLIGVSTPSGDVATLGVVGQGGAVGEQSLLRADGRRTASATALGRVETLYLSRSVFDELRTMQPQVDRFLVSLLDARIRILNERLLAALYVPAPERVLRCVEDLAVTFGKHIPLTQDDIASMAGTTRSTTNRILRQAEDAGAIRIARGNLTVVDAHAIRLR